MSQDNLSAGESPFPLKRGDDDPFPLLRSGDEDPYPLEIPGAGGNEGKWVIGKGTYRAFQVGPVVQVFATGEVTSSIIEARLIPSILAVFPPDFGLYFLVSEVRLPVLLPFKTPPATFLSERRVETVVVVDADGKQIVPVTQSPE